MTKLTISDSPKEEQILPDPFTSGLIVPLVYLVFREDNGEFLGAFDNPGTVTEAYPFLTWTEHYDVPRSLRIITPEPEMVVWLKGYNQEDALVLQAEAWEIINTLSVKKKHFS